MNSKEKTRLLWFLILSVYNLSFSFLKQYNNSKYEGFYWFVNLMFPFWITILGGTFIGVFIFLFSKKPENISAKLLSSKISGMLVTAIILAAFYTMAQLMQRG